MTEHWDGEQWDRPEGELARRIPLEDVSNKHLLKRLQGKQDITIQQGTRALLVEEGRLRQTLEPGKHRIESWWERVNELRRSKDIEIILVDLRPKTVSFAYDDLRSKSDFTFAAAFDLDIKLDKPSMFYHSVMQDKDVVSVDDLKDELDGALENGMQASIKDHSYDEVYGNPAFTDEVEGTITEHARDVLNELGVRFIRVRYFDFDDNLDEVHERRRKAKKEVMKEKAELDAEEERDKLRDRISEIRKQAIDREKEQAIEKEQAEQAVQEERQEKEKAAKAHREKLKTKTTEEEVTRREKEWEQDMDEMDDLMAMKRRLDEQKIQREQDKIETREDAALEVLATLEETDDDTTELAKMEKAKEMATEKLEALGAQDSDELGKARQEANRDVDEKRLEDQKDMMEQMVDVMDQAMETMGDTAASAADGETKTDETSDADK